MIRILLAFLMTYSLSIAEDIYEDDLTADVAYEMQKKGEAIIVDVRTSLEYLYTGHGEGFINITAYDWTYEPKSLESRVKSSEYEVKNTKVKDHLSTMKLFDAKELINTNFVPDVMKAMKLRNVDKVILVCRSGPRSKAAANLLAKEGITAYNLEDGYTFGWKDEAMPWGGQ